MKQTTEKVFALNATPNKTKAVEKSATAVRAQEPGSDPKRLPWSGGVKGEELARPGGPLLAMLVQRANELGHNMADMAGELGFTYGYISQLRNGQRQVTTIRDKFVDACAAYLGVARITVLLAAGKVKPTDIYEDPQEVMRRVPDAINFMRKDGKWGPMMTPEILSGDLATQFLVVKLYEAATQRVLLPGATTDASAVAHQVQALLDYQRTLKERAAESVEELEEE
jgi:hypothetical protein